MATVTAVKRRQARYDAELKRVADAKPRAPSKAKPAAPEPATTEPTLAELERLTAPTPAPKAK